MDSCVVCGAGSDGVAGVEGGVFGRVGGVEGGVEGGAVEGGVGGCDMEARREVG